MNQQNNTEMKDTNSLNRENKEEGSKLGVIIGVFIRWILTGVMTYYLFRENIGTATRIFFVLLTIRMEIESYVKITKPALNR